MAYSLTDNKVEELSSGLRSCGIDDHENIKIRIKLKQLDIHFNWNLHQIEPGFDNPQEAVTELNIKIKKIFGDDSNELIPSYNFFCCQLTIAQELIRYDARSALKKVLECEPWVMNLKKGSCEEKEFMCISKAVEYIYLGCKAFVLFKCGSFAEAKEVLLKVPDLSKMKDKQLSGIYGIKASAFLAYGLEGYYQALDHIEAARSKHPTMAHWHFVTGITMSRLRHREAPHTLVPEEEVNFYRTAYVSQKSNPKYAMFLALIMSERASGLAMEFRDGTKTRKESLARVNEMNNEALSIYTMLIKKNQKEPNILARSAFGMAKLPKHVVRIDFAKKAIEQALRLYPDNRMVNHYAGLIYHRYVKDNVKGLQYLNLAADMNNYPAIMDLVKLKYLLDPKLYDPIPELTSALFEYKEYFSQTSITIASWYSFIKHDVFHAWDYLKKIGARSEGIGRTDNLARSHKCIFLIMKKPCNLYEVIFDEVKSMIALKEYRNEEEKETLILMSKELQVICVESHPTEFKCLRECILNECDRLVISDGKKPKARSEGRGRARNMRRGNSTGPTRNTPNTRGRMSNYVRGGSLNSGRGSRNSVRSSNKKPLNIDWWDN